ncbi:DUF3971 domain-containing protein [Microvirga thermotolerans]|uniref:DUF3971 domain-containing protein n=1 Tax=Microvirga thermotolerans TaxID=2651334 RepID=A0A5P9JVX2_9HYPH|nr:DUF3971 domain-containing protein [Microvirga thermotolerans]QFU16359.1 hypothetical protein GDR74_09040 [Microvirga thermotolerans]
MKPFLRTRSPRPKPAKRSAVRRVIRGALYVKLGLVLFACIALGILYMRLSAGPLSFGRLPERVAEALASRIGPGWSVTLRNTAIGLQGSSPVLMTDGLDVRGPDGALVLRAPSALVSVDGFSLLSGNLQPKSIELRDLQLRVLVNRDGSLTFGSVPGGDAGEAGAASSAPAASSGRAEEAAAWKAHGSPGASPVSGAVGSLFELVIGPQSILSTLDRARVANAHLVFVDAGGRQRGGFDRLDATFDWSETGGRRFSATVEGPKGSWQLGGDARVEGGGYRAAIAADGAPIQDILLLTGLSALPATTDLAFSGRVDAAYADGRVTELKARLDADAGVVQIDDKDTSPLKVDHAAIEASWDEAARALDLSLLELVGGGNRVRLQGRLLTAVEKEGWRLSLAGRDLILSGPADGDKPVRIGTLGADLCGPDGVALKSIRLEGPELSAEIGGILGTPADPHGLNLTVRAARTDVRNAIRIWPEAVAPPVRTFLKSNLKAGLLETFALKVAMTGDDIVKAVSGGPIPEESLAIDFAISNGVLKAAEGLPPVSGMSVTGQVTGRKVMLQAPTGRVDMPGERSLAASEGTFRLENYWDDNALAKIDFRLAGSAEALGALLQQPLVHEIAGFDVDPATMKGKTDLRVGIGLAVNNVPAFADLPLKVSGTVSEFGIDKVFGKDRLENANLAIAYDRGNLAIKGEGRMGGSPASIDVRKTPAGGEANVAFSLDDAARARRGLAFGSQLTGPLPIKASLPLGSSAKSGIRVEADLTKAGVDQLIPGWVKPAGRPGRLSFVMVEGPTVEIRDLQLEAGSAQLSGSAVLSAEGSLEKADLSTFKLSPGDDMRAQIDRVNGVYKVTIRGNVGDARPFTKTVGAPAPSAGRGGNARDSKDFDLDVALNILAGYNSEAITNAALRLSMRKDSIRQVEMKGRLGATDIVAKTLNHPGMGPTIVLQAQDAGALLRFLDIYRRMVGGDLVLQMAASDGPQAGMLTLKDFALKNEPALRRIIPTQTQVVAGQDRAGNPQAVRVDVNEVTFTKARVEFTRNAGRLDFKDAAIFGDQVGFTLSGYIDNARDRMDISGTFVPAYGLNNAFAQVPLFGPLLGGGQYEGLFAVNFRVAGPSESPTLTVNPLSAVAPGFLRKLFGAGGGAAQAGEPPAIPDR